ncbi:CLUMA_CG016866, isoform A [Clunio marinus]|uniref:CLUMA_CG016866, isoform A n=1 Tax=Clunio marinus TaxID=568069 RepID=A0A1J1IWN7_9DIPT|nr:CLUMA_CG016866, isoform A [Clunio marinus]
MVDSLSVLSRVMDFQSAMETFAEAWVAANVTQQQEKKERIKILPSDALFTPEPAINVKKNLREVQSYWLRSHFESSSDSKCSRENLLQGKS